MPRKIIKKIMPSQEKVKSNKFIAYFGDRLNHPKIWGTDRKSIALALAVGFFVAFIPMPFQMFLVAILAILLKFNLPLSALIVWISNPITMPFIYYIEYKLGNLLISSEESLKFEFTLDWINNNWSSLFLEMYVGAFVISAITAILSYCFLTFYWKIKIKKNRKEKN